MECQVIGLLRRGQLALRHNFLVNTLDVYFVAVFLLRLLLSLNIWLAALNPLWIDVGGLHACDAWVELISVLRDFVLVLRQRLPLDILLGELPLQQLAVSIALVVDAGQAAVDVFAHQ